MGKITELVAEIRSARLARDVRGAIADSIEAVAYKMNEKKITVSESTSVLFSESFDEGTDEVEIFVEGGTNSNTGAILIKLGAKGPYQVLKPAASIRSHIRIKRMGFYFAIESNDFSFIVETSEIQQVTLIASGITFNSGTTARIYTA